MFRAIDIIEHSEVLKFLRMQNVTENCPLHKPDFDSVSKC